MTNALAPPGLRVPPVLPLGVLTGVASLVPIVVGKVVSLPVVGYPALSAVGAGGAASPSPGSPSSTSLPSTSSRRRSPSPT